jgi:hypothetical protein
MTQGRAKRNGLALVNPSERLTLAQRLTTALRSFVHMA